LRERKEEFVVHFVKGDRFGHAEVCLIREAFVVTEDDAARQQREEFGHALALVASAVRFDDPRPAVNRTGPQHRTWSLLPLLLPARQLLARHGRGEHRPESVYTAQLLTPCGNCCCDRLDKRHGNPRGFGGPPRREQWYRGRAR